MDVEGLAVSSMGMSFVPVGLGGEWPFRLFTGEVLSLNM